MPCTTILVGKKASYDGSTMIARNDDSPSGQFTPKKFVVVHPEEQPRKYKSVLSHVEIDLPEDTELFVTPRDIDTRVRDSARLVGYAIDLALHDALTIEDIDMFLA